MDSSGDTSALGTRTSEIASSDLGIFDSRAYLSKRRYFSRMSSNPQITTQGWGRRPEIKSG